MGSLKTAVWRDFGCTSFPDCISRQGPFRGTSLMQLGEHGVILLKGFCCLENAAATKLDKEENALHQREIGFLPRRGAAPHIKQRLNERALERRSRESFTSPRSLIPESHLINQGSISACSAASRT